MKQYKVGNKSFTAVSIIIVLIVFGIMAGAIIYSVSTPAEIDKECTVEYVQQNGDKDCEFIQKKADIDSQIHIESQRP